MSVHFTAEAWADLARSVAEPSVQQALRTHLDSGCAECARELERWRAVYELARQEPGYEPPEAAVRMAEQCFARYGPERGPARLVRFLRAAFDSLQQPALAGVRASGQATRQVLYESDGFMVDVHTELGPGSTLYSLVGQVLDSARPGRRLADLPIVLHQSGSPVAQTTTNEHGEFRLSVEAGEDLWISVDVGRRHTLVMVLAGFGGPLAGSP